MSVSEIAPPFPLECVDDMQLVNVAEEPDVPSIQSIPPLSSVPLNTLLPSLLDMSLNVHDVSVTMGDPLNVIVDVSINTPLPLVADPKFTLVRMSALPLTENTGVVREAESVNVMDWTVSDADDTTNTPSDPAIDATDFVTDPL